MHSHVRPNTHIALRLPSGILKLVETTPNTNINLGKFGTFNSNQIIGRPYRLTYEFLEQEDPKAQPKLRVVPASELHAEALGSDHVTPAESREDDAPAEGGVAYDIVGEDGEVIMRNNRLTVDDPSRQTLSMDEIEELKKAGSGSGKDIIEKIMASHMGIEEKTKFSLAKYTLRKSRKYLKRFTVLSLDIPLLTEYVTEKEAYRIMELRDDSLGLICSWANVHSGATSRVMTAEDGTNQVGGGRWLVVDDTGGLVTAALAERMGILYPPAEEEESDFEDFEEEDDNPQPEQNDNNTPATTVSGAAPTPATEDTPMPNATTDVTATAPDGTSTDPLRIPRKPRQHIPQSSASTNTLTVLHPNNQPNLSHLKYFGFDAGDPTPSHPLYTHLKSLSWLQLLSPADDPTYLEPEVIPEETLATLKSSKRGNYYRKRRRWERTKRVVDETRAGGFDGLVVASSMEPVSVLKGCVPLVKGGGQVVVYSPNAEPLVQLCDYYSKERRTAYIASQFGQQAHENGKRRKQIKLEEEEKDGMEGEDEEDSFPVNPTLLLAPSLQTARARQWQVLPGRTHAFMTSRGGADGFLFTATRVLPIEGKVEARGLRGGKKRKTGAETSTPA
ncbi:tRNA (adenine(58)-N(1))-methyltransferase non-catalytic subunit trm6 [Didymosphaeria variabile]|uniref:tRNA (adenine(58)-N(1))-methyltransferase non-catalytic subunit TRM6 n=1 Tax=Didymosphaeria variabile TaxID=1932322 RepID=A0A9W8XLF5_9PLEO|nr:tRNA (adenine(58)-N(1))-methyltransferase non-catalytic subunit trm6 [Didymosphaeria variabile]KAJ4354087.1 tRNA (adenine(58)-N(1))-methyltransferase non-catalytic subunit trm6 [Didymosphaeria variabile]